MDRFDTLLQELRDIRGLTQADLATRSGVSRHAISDIESGLRDPKASTLDALLRALGMELCVRPLPMRPAADRDVRIDVDAYVESLFSKEATLYG